MEWKKITMALAICVMLLLSLNGAMGEQTITTRTVGIMAETPPPIPPNLALDQQQSTFGGAAYMGNCNGHPWQSFVPNQSVLAAGAIHIGFDNPTNTDNLTMHIRTTPTGPDLTKVTIPESKIIIGDWVVFDFPDINVVPGRTYYMVMDNEGEVSFYGWSEQPFYDSYLPGTACYGENTDWTFATYYPLAIPTVSISTDKVTYATGDTMNVTLNITNPTANPVALEWYIGVPQSNNWITKAKVSIPAGYSNTYTIPMPVGNWGPSPLGLVHYVHLLNPTTQDVLAQDSAVFAYRPIATSALKVDIVEELTKQRVKIIN